MFLKVGEGGGEVLPNRKGGEHRMNVDQSDRVKTQKWREKVECSRNWQNLI